MPLKWDLSAIANRDETCFDLNAKGERVEMKSLTHTLIMMSMAVGLSGITKANWQEWYRRLYTLQRMNGALLRDYDDATQQFTDYFITPADVYAHIGLSVNVANETARAWSARIARDFMDRTAYDARRSAEAFEKERTA